MQLSRGGLDMCNSAYVISIRQAKSFGISREISRPPNSLLYSGPRVFRLGRSIVRLQYKHISKPVYCLYRIFSNGLASDFTKELLNLGGL